MTEPWEETTWTATPADRDWVEDWVYRSELAPDMYLVLEAPATEAPDDQALLARVNAAARLAACAPEMWRALAELRRLWPSIEMCTPVDDKLRALVNVIGEIERKAGIR